MANRQAIQKGYDNKEYRSLVQRNGVENEREREREGTAVWRKNMNNASEQVGGKERAKWVQASGCSLVSEQVANSGTGMPTAGWQGERERERAVRPLTASLSS